MARTSFTLGTAFDRSPAAGDYHVFCSGPIDAWLGHDAGRLGTYRYIGTHVKIAEALDAAQRCQENLASGTAMESFVLDPL